MIAFKRYASRALNNQNRSGTRRWWARHGSTRYLWTKDDLSSAIKYVVDGQGERMARWIADERGNERPLVHETNGNPR